MGREGLGGEGEGLGSGEGESSKLKPHCTSDSSSSN